LLHALSLAREWSPHVERPGYLGTLTDVAWSLVDQRRFDYLDRNDLGPFVQGWWNLLGALPVVPQRRVIGPASESEAVGHPQDWTHTSS